MSPQSLLIVLDVNCWIEATRDGESASRLLIQRARTEGHRLAVSKHSLSEMDAGSAKHGTAALTAAQACEELPYFPIGTIGDLLGTIGELAGTMDDAAANERLREELGRLAKNGADIHDRGALIDAVRSGADYFVSYDKALVGEAPRRRIEGALRIKLRRPAELLGELNIKNGAESARSAI
jgi:predicted nucleic acid-binding protein